MSATFAEAEVVRTAAQIFQALADDLATEGIQAVGWPEESVHRGLLELESRSLAAAEAIRAQLLYAGFLDTAELAGPTWFDRLLQGFFGLTRLPATKAVHTFQFTNLTSGGPYESAIGQRTAVTPTGILFRNSGVGTLPAGAGQVIPGGIEFTADVAGIVGNIAANSTLSFQAGAIPGVNVSNPPRGTTGSSLVRAGRDVETMASAKARAFARWGATSAGGSAEALVEWIVKAFEAQGLVSTITRWRIDDTNPNGPGSVDGYLANGAGGATVEELAIVDAYWQARRGAGMGPLRTLAAVTKTVPVVGTLFVTSNDDALADAIEVLDVLAAETPIGGIVYGAEIVQRLMGVTGAINFAPPPADIELDINEVPDFDTSDFSIG